MRRLKTLMLALLLLGGSGAGTLAASPVLEGHLEQGGLVFGKTAPGTKISLDGIAVPVGADGSFLLGFDRDHGPHANLSSVTPDGHAQTETLAIALRDWQIQRVEGVPPKYVTPPADELARIQREVALKKAARPFATKTEYYESGFIWPATGRISGVFGSQRFYNGEPRKPHYGVDVAAPAGTPVVAPADGVVTLARPDMYFEGGLIFIDHGQGLISVMMHLSKVEVKAGQKVQKGEKIGAVGATGRATGPHLHWGMWWRDAHLDPALLVPPMPGK
ncbi:MAG: M23 family metallopeptidase [Parvibaculaceae bacterium]|nr:M23 family metallopeptidase [Parvibaculaceae bacterium]